MTSLRTDIMALIEQQTEVATDAAMATVNRAIAQAVDQLSALVMAKQALQQQQKQILTAVAAPTITGSKRKPRQK